MEALLPALGDHVFIACGGVFTGADFADSRARSDFPNVAHVKDANSLCGINNPQRVAIPHDTSSMNVHTRKVIISIGIHQQRVAVLLSCLVDKRNAHLAGLITIPTHKPTIFTIVGANLEGICGGRDALRHPLLSVHVVVILGLLPREFVGAAAHFVVAIVKDVRDIDSLLGVGEDFGQRGEVFVDALVCEDEVFALSCASAFAVVWALARSERAGDEDGESRPLHCVELQRCVKFH